MAIFMENDPAMLRHRGRRRAHRALLHPGQLLSLGRGGGLRRQRLPVPGRRDVGGQGGGGRAAPGAVPQGGALDHGQRRRQSRRPVRVLRRGRRCATDGSCGGRADGCPHDVFVGDDGATQRDPPPHVRHPPLGEQHRGRSASPCCGASATTWCTCRRRRCTTPPRRSAWPSPADEVDGDRDGALRSGAVSRPRGAVPGHALPGRPDHVHPHAQAAARGAGGGGPVVVGDHHPRGGAVPGAGEGADDRVVRADPARVLRGDRGERRHLHHLRGLAGAQGQRRAGRPQRDPHPRRRGSPVSGRARRGRSGSPAPRTSSTSAIPRRRRAPGGTVARPARSATSGTWTRTATSS